MLTFILLSICAFGATCLMFIVIFRMREISSESKELSKRLQFWLSEKSSRGDFANIDSQKEDTEETFIKRVLLPLGEQVGNWMSEKVPYNKQSAVKKLLIKAGYRDKKAIQIFYAIKVSFGIALVVISVAVLTIFGKNIQSSLSLVAIAGIFGFILPNLILDKKATERQQNIDRILPDALDLLVICTEAGMGIDQSLLRVAANLGNKGKDLTEEIILTNREMNLGQDRNVCWNNLGERGGSEELKNLARVISQSEKVGASIASVLRGQSKFLIVKRRQKAEETAAKMSIKMMLPLGLFIFPCIMAVTIGPPMLKLVATFTDLGK